MWPYVSATEHRGHFGCTTGCAMPPSAYAYRHSPRRQGGARMPYKDPLRKEEWEEQHRLQRLARRRELRRIEKIRQEAHPELARVQTDGSDFLVPLVVAGCGLALCEPMIGVGVGGLTLLFAVLYKKG